MNVAGARRAQLVGEPRNGVEVRPRARHVPGDEPHGAAEREREEPGARAQPASQVNALLGEWQQLLDPAVDADGARFSALPLARRDVEEQGGIAQPDSENPDCIWFEENTGARPPQCANRRPLIEPARQKEIARFALLAFFDGYLKGDAEALARLDRTDQRFDEVILRREVDGE